MSDGELLNANVKITADIAELESGMNRAEDKVTSSVHHMEESAEEGSHKISESFKEMGEAMEAYLSVEVLKEFGDKLLETATEMEVMGQKAKIVFGESLESVKKWAEESAAKMGLTADAAVNLAAKTGDLLVPMGFTREAATKMSIETINLAGALARWTGGTKSAADASQALAHATLGHTRELQAYGIKISEADIKAVLYAKHQNTLTGEHLSQARAQAILALAYSRSTDAQTAYAQDSDSLLVLQNKIKSAFGELEEKLAKALTPAFKVITLAVQDAVHWFSSLPSSIQGIVVGIPIAVVALIGLVATIATAKNASLILKATFGDVFGNIKKVVVETAPKIALAIGESIWPVTLVIAACAALYLAYKHNFLGIQTFLKPIIETIQKWFGSLSYHFQAVASNQEEVGKIIKELWHSLVEFFRAEVTAIGKILSGVGLIFYGAFIEPFIPVFQALENAGKMVGQGLSSIVQSIGRILAPVFSLLSAMGVAVGDLFKSAVSSIGGFLSNAFTGAASTMQAAASSAASHSTTIQKGLNMVKDGANEASNAYSKMGSAGTAAWNKLSNLKPIKTSLEAGHGEGEGSPSYTPDMSGVNNSGAFKDAKAPKVAKEKKPKVAKPKVASVSEIRDLKQAYDDLHQTYKKLVDSGKITQTQADDYAKKLRELHDRTTDLNLSHNAQISALAGVAKGYQHTVDSIAAATIKTAEYKAIVDKLKNSLKAMSDAEILSAIARLKGHTDALSIQKLAVLQTEEGIRATAAHKKATVEYNTELERTKALITTLGKSSSTTNADADSINLKNKYEQEIVAAGTNKIQILAIEQKYQADTLALEKNKLEVKAINEITAINDSYQKQYALDKKAGVTTVELTKQYTIDKAAIRNKETADYTALVVASQKTIDTATQNSTKYIEEQAKKVADATKLIEEENKLIIKFNNDAASYLAKTKTETNTQAYQDEITAAEGNKLTLYQIEQKYSAQIVKDKQDELRTQKESALDSIQQTYDAAVEKAAGNTDQIKNIDTAYQIDKTAVAAYWNGKISDAQVQADRNTGKLRLAAEAELQKNMADLKKSVVSNSKDLDKAAISYDPNSQSSYLEKNLQPSVDLKDRIDADITTAQTALDKANILFTASQTAADKARVDSLNTVLASLQGQQSEAAKLIVDSTVKFIAQYGQETADATKEANLRIAQEQYNLGQKTEAQYQIDIQASIDYWKAVVATAKVGSTEWTKAIGNVNSGLSELSKTQKEDASKFVTNLGDLSNQGSLGANKKSLEGQLATFKTVEQKGSEAYKIIDAALKTLNKDSDTWAKFSSDQAVKLLGLAKEQAAQTVKGLQSEKAGKLALVETDKQKAEIELAYSAQIRAAQVKVSQEGLADALATLEAEQAVAVAKEGLTQAQIDGLNSFYTQKKQLAKDVTKVEIDGINLVADTADKANQKILKSFKDYLLEFIKGIGSAIASSYVSISDANTKYLADMSAATTPEGQAKAGTDRQKTVDTANNSAGTSVVSAAAALLGAAFPQFKMLIDILAPIIEKMPGLTSALEKIGSVFIKILDTLAPVFGYIGDVVAGILDAIMPLIDALATILKPLLTVFVSLLEVVIKPLLIVLKPLIEFVATILTFVYSIIKTVWNAIAGFLNGINIFGWKPFDLKLLPDLNTGSGIENAPSGVGTAPAAGATGGTGSSGSNTTTKSETVYNTPVNIWVNEASDGVQVARLVEQAMIRTLRNS